MQYINHVMILAFLVMEKALMKIIIVKHVKRAKNILIMMGNAQQISNIV